MATIKGQNLRLFIGSGANAKPIAAAKSCQVHIAANTEETSTKDSADWAENEVVGKSWDLSSDALVIDTDSGGAKTGFDFIALVGTTVTVKFANASGANNRTAGTSVVSGTGIIQDINFTAANKTNSTYSVKIVGTGALS